MPFLLIKGVFTPLIGQPDGDSVRFLANDLDFLLQLEGRRPNISPSNRTVQLRFEGIDSIEKAATQPLATESKDSMLNLIGYDETTNPTPEGFIVARMTDDTSGRPICFVFAGNTAETDGREIFLDRAMLRNSVNYQQMLRGFAYPLYYNTLFADLRQELNLALREAQDNRLGYWPEDATLTGVTINDQSDLATIPPIWPKLWRRLQEYLRNAETLAGFREFLAAKNERLDIISLVEERSLEDIVEVDGNQVKLLVPPEDIRVVGKAGARSR